MNKIDLLEKKIKDSINYIGILKTDNKKFKRDLDEKNIELKLKDKEILNLKKELANSENLRQKNLEIKKKLTIVLEKLEGLEK